MQIKFDLSKEYGLVLEGGGARGAYQIGAWKAFKEVGLKINAVAGSSVGALNGGLICMDDVYLAEKIWKEMTFSRVLDVNDEEMDELLHSEKPFRDVASALMETVQAGGFGIEPLKELLTETLDESKIRNSNMELCITTFSLTDFKRLDLSVKDIPEGQLADFLLASSYLLMFRGEKLHGKRYLDGAYVNKMPTDSLVNRGYKDIIEIRLHSIGPEARVKIPEDGSLHTIISRVDLGRVIEFDSVTTNRNLQVGYFDALRLLYGLEGFVYYIDQTHSDEWFEEKLKNMTFAQRREFSIALKIPITSSAKDLYLAILEGSAKLLKVPKYHVYTVDSLLQIVMDRYTVIHPTGVDWSKVPRTNSIKQWSNTGRLDRLPKFTHYLYEIEKGISMDLKGRHLLTLKDYSTEEILFLLDLAADLKDKKKRNIPVDFYKGKNIALIFEKASTRTRCAFEVACVDMGMGFTYLGPDSSQIGKKESIKDTARVLGRLYDGIQYRGFGQGIVEELAEYAGVPVWNGLTNEYHPTQALADLMTIREKFGRLKGIKLVYLGDVRYNMGNSLMIACAKMGMHFVACSPKEYFPNEELVEVCKGFASESGAMITLTEDIGTATMQADVIYTDVWLSMGEPIEIWEERIKDLTPYKVTSEVMANAAKEAIFLHCLPSFHDRMTEIGKEMGDRFDIQDMEVTDEVFESEQSLVFVQAENRMHTIKAVMMATLK